MNKVAILIGLVAGIPTKENIPERLGRGTDEPKACTIDEIAFKCNNGRMHFEFENCSNDDSDNIRVNNETTSECSLHSSRLDFGYEDCGTSKTLTNDEITYTASLQRYEENPSIIVTEELVRRNRIRTFTCTLSRKFIASTEIKIERPQSEEAYTCKDAICFANKIVETDGNIKAKKATAQESENLTENETDDFFQEDGDIYHYNSACAFSYSLFIPFGLTYLLISFN